MTSGNRDRQAARTVIRQTLAADLACPERALIDKGVTIHEASDMPGRRRFPREPKSLLIATLGSGVAVSANRERLGWLQDRLVGLERDMVFGITTAVDLAALVEPEGQIIIGPTLGYTCTFDDLRIQAVPINVDLEVVEETGIADLYAHSGFEHALRYDLHRTPEDKLAVTAWMNGAIVGIAGASADTDDLWQIGVDVLPTAQGHGIGRAVVQRLTERILADGHVPYYTAAASNIGSRSIAIGLGYWPAFTAIRAQTASKRMP